MPRDGRELGFLRKLADRAEEVFDESGSLALGEHAELDRVGEQDRHDPRGIGHVGTIPRRRQIVASRLDLGAVLEIRRTRCPRDSPRPYGALGEDGAEDSEECSGTPSSKVNL